jgi:hypothetical protein
MTYLCTLVQEEEMADDGLSKKLPFWASQTAWPTAISGKDRLRLRPEPVLESYQPNSRDRMIGAMADFLYGGGKEGYRRADNTMNILDWTPIGTLNDAYDAGRAIGEGRWGDAALTAGLGILPGRSEKLLKRFKRGFKGLDELPGHSLINSKSDAAADLAKESLDGNVIRKADDYEIYNPPEKPQRPFAQDYTNGAPADATGKLTEDMEGRKLGAKNIFGRQALNGPDVGATAEQVETIGEDLSGNKIRLVPRQSINGAHGVSRFDAETGKPTQIEIADDLPQPERQMVTGHEVGHFIEEAAGQISTKDLDDELRFIYGTTATGKESRPPRVGPEKYYTGEEIPRELMTEAIRTYMVNPNWIKTVAPRTAARIRHWVNTHPELSKIVQFNSLAAGVGGIALGGQSEDSEARDLARPEDQQPLKLPRPVDPILGTSIPFELMNGASKAGSYGIAKVADALFQRGLFSQPPGAGTFNHLAQALMNLRSKQRAPSYGGPK